MTQASETPSLIQNAHAGGVGRNKAGFSARRRPRFSESVSAATGMGAALYISAALLSSAAAMAADSEPPPPAPPAPTKEWPPPVQMLSQSAPLSRKSTLGVNLVHQWQAKNVKPSLGARGEIRFIFGTEATVVCAPLRLCDIALQAGEIVQNVNLGDPVMWSCPPAISGSGAAEVTHLMCKPADAGLETSLAIQTSRRSYSINLVSTRKNYMPMVSWSYPEDQAAQWSAYQQRGGVAHQEIPAQGYIHYELSGNSPPWKPVTVYSDGKSTFVNFPPSMAYGKAPVLERLP